MNDSLIEVIALTFDILGKILVVVAAISVHDKVRKEHRIDSKVLGAITKEKLIAFSALVFMILAYVLKIFLALR